MEVFNKDGAVGKILGDLVELRRLVGGLKAERKGGVPFPVKSAKDLMSKLRGALDEMNMSILVTDQQITHVPSEKQIIVHVVTTIRIVSSDGTFVESVGSGHGASNDDKAGGKADTYAWKSAVVKALSIPDEDMVDTDDESKPVEPKKQFNFGGKSK